MLLKFLWHLRAFETIFFGIFVFFLTMSADTLQVQKGSRSKHAEPEVSSSWAGAQDLKKVEEELDANMDPSSGSARWKSSSSSSSQAQCQYDEAGQKAAALAQMSQTGSWRRGMTAQVGITPPRSKGSSAALKTTGTPTKLHFFLHVNKHTSLCN